MIDLSNLPNDVRPIVENVLDVWAAYDDITTTAHAIIAAHNEIARLREHIRATMHLAKNDAMMMENMSRHQPVPETATTEFASAADNAMLAVNAAFVAVGEQPPFSALPASEKEKPDG